MARIISINLQFVTERPGLTPVLSNGVYFLSSLLDFLL
jgi:hypothetical protein